MTLDLSDVPSELREAVAAALAGAGVADGHLAVELVGGARIRELNRRHREIDKPTDVLAFPVDGIVPSPGPRELGDVAICPEHCTDVVEAAVHGTLHLCGYDHEADDGAMLELQERVLASLRGVAGAGHPPTSDRGSEGPSVSDSPGPSESRGSGRSDDEGRN